MHRHDREQRDVDRVVEVVVADDDVGHVLGADAEVAQRREDEGAVGHHARIDDDDPSLVADEAHRAGDVRPARVTLDQDVEAGRAREFGHPADGNSAGQRLRRGRSRLRT